MMEGLKQGPPNRAAEFGSMRRDCAPQLRCPPAQAFAPFGSILGKTGKMSIKTTSWNNMAPMGLSPGASTQAARGQSAWSRGFTLIELMVVLVIIGVLAALIVPNVLDRTDDARATAAKTDVNNLMQALKLYKLDNQRFPSSEQGLAALVTKPTSGPIPANWKPYLDKLPNDPWGRTYVLLNPGVKGEIDVLSFGADGQPGGEGKNADIGSW